MNAGLTDKQIVLLVALRVANTDRNQALEDHTAAELTGEGYLPDTPAEGLHRTAASLVRKGLVKKARLGRVVAYGITQQGLDKLAEITNAAITVGG